VVIAFSGVGAGNIGPDALIGFLLGETWENCIQKAQDIHFSNLGVLFPQERRTKTI